MKSNDSYGSLGQFNGRGEVRLVRTLPGPIERIWEYLTDPEKRSRWFAGGPMEQKKGGKAELFFHHKNIAPGETPPDDHKNVQDPGFTMAVTVLRWEPPHVLSYTFDDNSDVTFELTPQGKDVVLVLTHRSRGEDIQWISGYGSGWHTHLAQLDAQLRGLPRPPFWPLHAKLKEEYKKLHAAAKS